MRRGISVPRPFPTHHQLAELVEQVARVVRARARLRVVLHAERGNLTAPDALDHSVVEVHVRDVGGVEPVGVDREVVVLARDLDLSGREVTDRMVAAVMSERQLERPRAQRGAEQLMSEADAEHGHFTEERFDVANRVPERRRIAGTVREEHAVGLAREHVARGRGRRDDFDASRAHRAA